VARSNAARSFAFANLRVVALFARSVQETKLETGERFRFDLALDASPNAQAVVGTIIVRDHRVVEFQTVASSKKHGKTVHNTSIERYSYDRVRPIRPPNVEQSSVSRSC